MTVGGRSRPRTSRGVALVRAAALALAAWPALAHDLFVSARDDGETLHVEAFYSNGLTPEGALVRVFDAENRLVDQSAIDADGRARFASPDAPAGLRVEVREAGHEAWWILTPDDIARQRAEAAARRAHEPEAD